MKRIGYLIILLLGMTFASCTDESADISVEEPLINAPQSGGEEDDDPVPPPGGGG